MLSFDVPPGWSWLAARGGNRRRQRPRRATMATWRSSCSGSSRPRGVKSLWAPVRAGSS